MFQETGNEFEHSFIPYERVGDDSCDGYPTNACTGEKVNQHAYDIIESIRNLTINPLSVLEWSLKCRMITILKLNEILLHGTDPATTFVFSIWWSSSSPNIILWEGYWCIMRWCWYGHHCTKAMMCRQTISRWPSFLLLPENRKMLGKRVRNIMHLLSNRKCVKDPVVNNHSKIQILVTPSTGWLQADSTRMLKLPDVGSWSGSDMIHIALHNL